MSPSHSDDLTDIVVREGGKNFRCVALAGNSGDIVRTIANWVALRRAARRKRFLNRKGQQAAAIFGCRPREGGDPVITDVIVGTGSSAFAGTMTAVVGAVVRISRLAGPFLPLAQPPKKNPPNLSPLAPAPLSSPRLGRAAGVVSRTPATRDPRPAPDNGAAGQAGAAVAPA